MTKKPLQLIRTYWREAAFVSFLLGVNAFLRFYRLAQQGLWHTDEVDYYFVCRDILRSFTEALSSPYGIPGKVGGLYATLELLTQYPPKFGFYLIQSIAWAVFPRPETTLFVNAFSSIATILVIFFIRRKFFNLRVAVIASTLFSFSLLYLRYSRNGFSMALTYLFLSLAVYQYLNFLHTLRRKYLGISGVILGCAFLIHPQVIFFVAVMLAAESVNFIYFYREKREEFLRRCLIFIVYFLIPFLTLSLIIFIGRAGHCYSAPCYLEQVFRTMSGNSVAWWINRYNIPIYPSYYVNLLWFLESPVIFILVIMSLFPAVRAVIRKYQQAQQTLLITALFVLPYVYWLLQRRFHQVEYNCLGAWPFLFLYIALGVDGLFRKIRSRHARICMVVVFLTVATSYSLYHLRTLFAIKSHFPEISRVFKERGVTKVIVYKTGAIYRNKDLDPYLKTVQMFPAEDAGGVDTLAREQGIAYCFYDSSEYFWANTHDRVVAGEMIAAIKNTTIRPHYPLFFMCLMNSGMQHTRDAELYAADAYDYMYLYEIRLP